MPALHGSSPRNGRHSRDDVAEAALRILDEFGLPDLTMRRLAAELDVQPSALYWHFPNKQTLLGEVADRIAARGLAVHDPLGHWMASTSAEAHRLRDALLAYRDGAEVVSSSFALGLGESIPLARLQSAITQGGFDEETCRRASTALLHFILGHVSHEQQRLQYDSIGVLAGVGGAPTVEAMHSAEADSTAEFGFGVQLILSGLEATARVDTPDRQSGQSTSR